MSSNTSHVDGDASPRFQYSIFIPVRTEETDDSAIQFVVHGLALPRIGERLHFDSAGGGLSVVVSDVDHTFFTREDDVESPHGDVVVTAELRFELAEDDLVWKLLDNAALNRWLSDFPRLESMFPD